jgi:cytochrome c
LGFSFIGRSLTSFEADLCCVFHLELIDYMKKIIPLLALLSILYSCAPEKPHVLVFSNTKGYRHASIKAGKAALQKLGQEKGFDVDTTEVSSDFNEENLKKYNAVVFLSTTGDVLDQMQQNSFKRFIQGGGGYVGIHAAADTEYDWWWYGKLVGAYFKSHPATQEAKFIKVKAFGNGVNLPDEWIRTDELYNYKKIAEDINVLYKLDETSYQGGENGDNHPIAWYHDFDGGRSFYTGMGHTDESFADPLYLDHVYQGILYAVGESKPDFSKATEKKMPEANRFTKVVLDSFFDEPTEMDILPDGRIIFLERKGNVKMYNPKTDSISVINTFNVNTKFEDGMLGLAHDPDFETNKWLYIYYSHPEKSANVLSRFVFDGEKIDQSSEKLMLEVATQRESCCHTGGSIVFGPGKNLFVSSGDNTNPFESDGYSPADERKGRHPYDAQGSSSNTNDLRGKILRIHPEPDGTYTIPEGNLFPKGEEKTRPEIYVMGNRNPYRISVDQRTGFLYWGEVGPDAGNEGPERGPRGYDEVNQAQKAGYFGWPLFVGGNYAYAKYDFEKKTVGPRHDPLKPINTSPNNTGKIELPPVSPPFIWYPYAESPDFPLVKTGGRNAMAGPVYYSENYIGTEGAFPEYMDGKLIIYDWMRNWIRLVTMNEKGAIMDIEPFLDGNQFNNTIDMAYGPDGKLYTLEYGTAWFKQNSDARLSRIDFNAGNRAPLAILKASKSSGALPMPVNFSAGESADPDGDAVTYELDINGKVLTTNTGEFSFTFDKAGIYHPKLTVTDSKGSKSSVDVTIIAGNEPPVIDIATDGSDRFLPGGSANYKVTVTDKEDGTTSDGEIRSNRVLVTLDFHPQGYDMTKIAQGHQRSEMPGKLLIAESDCKSCHLIDQKSAGPAYRDVAKRYAKEVRAVELLSDKVLKGGSGVWGEVAMAAHPQLTRAQTVQMVEYILSLAKEEKVTSLPLSGKANFAVVPPPGPTATAAYVLTVTYEDNGANGMPSLSSTKQFVLKSPSLRMTEATDLKGGIRKMSAAGYDFVENITHNSSLTFTDIDLTGVSKLNFVTVEMGKVKGGEIEVRLDSPDGTQLGTVSFTNSPRIEVRAGIFSRPSGIALKEVTGKHNLVLIFKNDQAGEETLFSLFQVVLGK